MNFLLQYRSKYLQTALLLVVMQMLLCFGQTLRVSAQTTAVYTLEPFIPLNLSAEVGEVVTVPIIVRNLNASALQAVWDSCTFFFRYNPTVLIPREPRQFSSLNPANNLMQANILLRLNRRVRNGDTIMRIPMTVCLGDVENTELSMDTENAMNYAFRVALGGNLYQSFLAVSGRLNIVGARWNGLLRTVNSNAEELTLSVSPSPLQTDAAIRVSIGALPPPPMLGVPTLAMYSAITGLSIQHQALLALNIELNRRLLGQRSAELQVQLPRAAFPRGIYCARFSYGANSVTRLVVVE